MAEFRLLTWDVQNLFAAGTKDGPPTQEAFDAKLRSLAEVLDAQQPDVAALQELGPPEVLAQLQDQLDHKLPHRQVREHPDGRGIRVGFLSRLPLQTRCSWTPSPPPWPRCRSATKTTTRPRRWQRRRPWGAGRCKSPSPLTATTSRS
jgi:hypothetical protein